jgi:hypothetical protein
MPPPPRVSAPSHPGGLTALLLHRTGQCPSGLQRDRPPARSREGSNAALGRRRDMAQGRANRLPSVPDALRTRRPARTAGWSAGPMHAVWPRLHRLPARPRAHGSRSRGGACPAKRGDANFRRDPSAAATDARSWPHPNAVLRHGPSAASLRGEPNTNRWKSVLGCPASRTSGHRKPDAGFWRAAEAGPAGPAAGGRPDPSLRRATEVGSAGTAAGGRPDPSLRRATEVGSAGTAAGSRPDAGFRRGTEARPAGTAAASGQPDAGFWRAAEAGPVGSAADRRPDAGFRRAAEARPAGTAAGGWPDAGVRRATGAGPARTDILNQ